MSPAATSVLVMVMTWFAPAAVVMASVVMTPAILERVAVEVPPVPTAVVVELSTSIWPPAPKVRVPVRPTLRKPETSLFASTTTAELAATVPAVTSEIFASAVAR
jgi:hypothetical protein